MSLFGYRFTLALVAALTISNLIFFFLFGFHQGFTAHIIMGIVVGLGLWLQSKFFRYVGAIWAAAAIGSVIWPLLSPQNLVWSYGLIWIFLLCVFNVLIFYNLLLSKRFSREFALELEQQPPYKKLVWKAFIIILVIVTVIATLNDIVNLVTTS